MIVFEIVDVFGRKIRLTKPILWHITKRTELKNQVEKLKETIVNPEHIRRSVKDTKVLIYYKHYYRTPVTEKYLAVILKTLNNEGFIISSYFTDRIKEGVEIWRKE